MHAELQRILKIGVEALEFEDIGIRQGMAGNRAAPTNTARGVLVFNNERYYQFVLAKAFLFALPYKIQIEYGSHDLVMLNALERARVVTIEMKRWMSRSGEREITSIKRDIFDKLEKVRIGLKFMLIFFASECGEEGEHSRWLIEKLSFKCDKSALGGFTTINEQGRTVAFSVLGLEVE